ncbi:MAG TPA: MerR family transcriptional regulator [Alphaproteobacteria bacterium]|nr:MerR family transcriptional regulator [Alphaproteobacteria bacterium]HBS76322.1 MerR family transcriptional regulator [Alphaproteobacteria bacterium]
MRIGEISKITGLSEHTLRFYEKMGLMPDVAKRGGGIRDYCDRDIDRLGIIECLKKTGMSLTDIKTFIDWCAMGDKTIQQRYDMFINRRAAVMAQMAEIQKMLKIIDYKIKYYDRARKAGTLAIYNGKKSKLPSFFDE